MTLAAGTRLGPYEILAPLGAGGMGEVYRARDTRLERTVAIKVLPPEVAEDHERLKRFEREARSASALNHPAIVTIYDVGQIESVSYIAMELVEGRTLRELITSGPLPIRKLLQIGTRVAEGLARAHEAGIVHRDLKPENLMVTKDGLVKILDFGLAKLTQTSSSSGEASQLPTETGTTPGVVLGTVGYMSPEQASGAAVDYRSDQFSFGAILYEMATGKRAFQKKTVIDTLSAILNEEPEPMASVNPQTPSPLRWIVERCLAKEPRERYASTEDLAHDLAGVRDHLSEVLSGAVAAAPVRRAVPRRVLSVLGMAALLAAGYFIATLRPHPGLVPRFQQVTFQQGAVWQARFAPDGQTVVYAMTSIGNDLKPVELYSTRVGSLDSRSLGLPPADILSISRSGRMAIALPENPLGFAGRRTLAEASLAGGTPRPILEDVMGADWSPDGKELAVSHRSGEKTRLEFPVGRVLYESTGRIGYIRVSPDGKTVAFSESKTGAPWTFRVVDRKGIVRTLVTLVKDVGIPVGMCWSPRGDELWWIEVYNSYGVTPVQTSDVHAVTLRGRDRVVTSLPGSYVLHDCSGDGRMLVEHANQNYAVSGFLPGETGDRSLAWLDQSLPVALSADGRMLLFADRGDTAGTSVATYLRKTDGSAAVRIGEGIPLALSPDGKWALVTRGTPQSHLVLLPTGAGQERAVSSGSVVVGADWARFHPDGTRIFFGGTEPGHDTRAYEQSIESGSPKPVTPEGMGPILLSQDGTLLLARGERDRDVTIFPTDPKVGSAPRIVPLLSVRENPVHWSADGRSLLISNDWVRPIRIDRLDISSGRRTLWRTFSPGGLLGNGGLTGLVFSGNEETWVAGYGRYFSELLVIDGLK